MVHAIDEFETFEGVLRGLTHWRCAPAQPW